MARRRPSHRGAKTQCVPYGGGTGAGTPIVKPKGIDDVPIVTVTLWAEDPGSGAFELGQVAHAIESELKRVPGTRDIYTIGAADHVVAVDLDPQALASRSLDPRDLRQALQAANVTRDNIGIVAHDQELLVQAGVFLSHANEIEDLVVGVHDGRPVFLRDVASVRRGPDTPQTYVWTGAGPASDDTALRDAVESPAVTIAVAKKPGTNAVEIAQRVIDRFNQLEGIYIPDNIGVQVTRNDGATADNSTNNVITLSTTNLEDHTHDSGNQRRCHQTRHGEGRFVLTDKLAQSVHC